MTALLAAAYFLLGGINAIIILLHLLIFWLLCDLIFFILRKAGAICPDRRIYRAGLTAVIITVLYLGYGWYSDRHVVITQYTVTSDKVTEPLRIVQFSDSHMGTTFDGEGFARHMETVNALDPDIILITGDYVDGSSLDEDIITATDALSTLSSTYGTYFCFGNHDKNAYGEEDSRQIKTPQLIEMLQAAGVTVLEDEVVQITDEYTLIGRRDLTETRLSAAELAAQADASTFIIDMNHQPNDYDNEAAAGFDLVLSGHTHGGQFFPIQNAGVWLGQNDRTYGYEQRGNTNFIVSSGISDWAIDFKTGCVSEIVVIEVVPQD